MAQALVTGGSGLLGWRAVEQLLGDGHEDVTDLTSLLRTAKRHRAERILHLAASIACRAAAAISDNVVGTANVFEVAMALDVRGVSWASTIAVNEARPGYAGEEVGEEYRGSPTQPYGMREFAAAHTGPPAVHHKHTYLMPATEVTGDEARASGHLIHLVEVEGRPEVQSFGRYLDALRRGEDGEWRIVERVVEVEADVGAVH